MLQAQCASDQSLGGASAPTFFAIRRAMPRPSPSSPGARYERNKKAVPTSIRGPLKQTTAFTPSVVLSVRGALKLWIGWAVVPAVAREVSEHRQ